MKRKVLNVGKVSSKTKRSKVKHPSVSKLMKKADTVFSKWLRYRNLDQNDMATCFTCGYKNIPSKMQAGHFVSRFYKIIRYDEDNVRVQCFICNVRKKGDYVTFRENLIKEIGESEVLRIESARKLSFKSSPEFYQAIIDKYEVR